MLGDSLLQEVRTSAALDTQCATYLFEPEQGNSESFKPVALVKSDAENPQGEIYHIHTDHLGTPQEVSNEAGEVVWAAQYRAYGAVKRQLKVAGSDVIVERQPDPSLTMNLRFMGQYFDQETGLHYNRHRYYDPECGQFTTQDPIGLMGGLNNYRCVPNPVNWVDSLGLLCKEQFKKISGKTYEGRIHRMEKPGQTATTSEAGSWNINASHRYSPPGQEAVYGGIDKKDNHCRG